MLAPNYLLIVCFGQEWKQEFGPEAPLVRDVPSLGLPVPGGSGGGDGGDGNGGAEGDSVEESRSSAGSEKKDDDDGEYVL